MKELQSEPALYAKFKGDLLHGLTGIYVDDKISGGSDKYEAWTKRENAYKTQPREFDQGSILGQQFSRDKKYWAFILVSRNLCSKSQTIAYR
jgi:hypothetical protein